MTFQTLLENLRAYRDQLQVFARIELDNQWLAGVPVGLWLMPSCMRPGK